MTGSPSPSQLQHAADPSVDPHGSPNVIGPRLNVPAMGIRPEVNRPLWFVVGVFLAQFGIFLALLTPVMVAMQLKINVLTDDPIQRAAMLGVILPPGALAALLFNAVGGRLSDRTTSRWGRRRPWLFIGMGILIIGFAIIVTGQNSLILALGWFIGQSGGNLAFSAFTASLADQLPDHQYGKVSGIVGIGQNVGIMAGTWVGALLSSSLLLLFMVPAVVAFVLVGVYALMLPDPVLRKNRYPFNVREFLGTFWTNPVKFPDFALAWWGRFAIILASFLFTTFRLLYMTEHLGLADTAGVEAVATGVTIYTILSMVAGLVGGWLSDKIGRRKVFVALSILVFALGTYLLLHADTVAFFYVCEAIMGVAYGIYLAVDLALVFEVLPNRENSGKDLGVFNMANALPQSLAPALGGWLLASLGQGTNFAPLLITAGVVGAIGAALTMLIRGVR